MYLICEIFMFMYANRELFKPNIKMSRSVYVNDFLINSNYLEWSIIASGWTNIAAICDLCSIGTHQKVGQSEYEHANSHYYNAASNPFRFWCSQSSAKIWDRYKTQKRCNIVARRNLQQRKLLLNDQLWCWEYILIQFVTTLIQNVFQLS